MQVTEQYLIRLDDITPDMNWSNFYKVKEILDRYQIKPLIGVVPDNQDTLIHFSEPHQDFFAYIRELQQEGYTISQHGYRHIYETVDSGLLKLNPFSEFAGLSYEEQYQKLKAGKEILEKEGIRTDIFMAPGHSYDANTIKALSELGFLYVTDGFYHRPYTDGGIVFVPCTMLESYKGTNINTLCFHLNRKTEEELREFENFIRKKQSSIIAFDGEQFQKQSVRKGVRVAISQGKFLILYRLKERISSSKALSEYMVFTYSSNPIVKMLKRVVCLPILAFKFLLKK